MIRLTTGFLLLGLCLLFGSCSDTRKSAISELEQRTSYQFTPEDYVRAVSRGDHAAIMLFERAGMAPNATGSGGRTALIAASGKGDLETVRRLLENGASLSTVDIDGRDALIAAAQGGHHEIARVLFNRGANLNHRDLEGWSGLSIAAYDNHEGMVNLLGPLSPIEALNEALLLAATAGHETIVDRLINLGASVEARSPDHWTPLMVAAKHGRAEVVRRLLEKRANPADETPDGWTAADIAEKAGHETIKGLITSHKGKSANPMTLAARDLKPTESDKPAETAEEPEATPEKPAKPLAALNGSTIRSGNSRHSALAAFKVEDFQQNPLPIALETIDGDLAVIRRIDPGGEARQLRVPEGRLIPETDFRVENLEKRETELPGETRNLRIRIQNIKTGALHVLTENSDTAPADVYAILNAPNSRHRFVAKPGDRFRTECPSRGIRHFEVFEVSPGKIELRDLENHSLVTVGH